MCRGSCSALSAMCHTGLPSPDGCQSSHSQEATRLGIKIKIFFIVWKRGAWLMQMAAPKAQSPGELCHVCFHPYLSPTALRWVSVTPAPKASWLLTPRDRCGELWALATLQRQGTAGGLTLCPCWRLRSTLKISLILASKGEGDPITSFPLSLGASTSWDIPAKATQWVGRLCLPCTSMVSGAFHLPWMSSLYRGV